MLSAASEPVSRRLCDEVLESCTACTTVFHRRLALLTLANCGDKLGYHYVVNDEQERSVSILSPRNDLNRVSLVVNDEIFQFALHPKEIIYLLTFAAQCAVLGKK